MAGRRQCEYNLLALSQSIVCDAMRKSGLNGSQLSKRMGVHRSWVHRILSGDCFISVGTLAKLLEACGFEITGMTTREVKRG